MIDILLFLIILCYAGRYVARLFFMGYWRRIEIDDLIPFDSEGRSLLPHTENYQELWSVLLAKAMLKIAALSWDSHREINDFNPIVCLTGKQIFLKVNC